MAQAQRENRFASDVHRNAFLTEVWDSPMEKSTNCICRNFAGTRQNFRRCRFHLRGKPQTLCGTRDLNERLVSLIDEGTTTHGDTIFLNGFNHLRA
jgi:hypothetical protein